MPQTPDDIIRDEIRALTAYHVADAAGMVKLDAMENPYPLPPALRDEIAACARDAALNRYPDPGARELKACLRETMQAPAGMDLVLGNGSDELIQMLALAVARPGAAMLGCEPSFAMFRMIAVCAGLRYVGVSLTARFALDVPAMLAAIETHRPALIFIAYPNNPTGNLFDAAALERVIAAAPGLVVIDEAYHAFAGRSFMPRLAEFPNLLVMRTVSKLGLAGLRLGLLAGRAEWLRHVDKLRLPYNVGVLTQRIAVAVLRHHAVLDEQAAAIRAARAQLLRELRRMTAVEAYDSDANFILFRVADANRTFDGLRARGVLIKNLHGAHPLLAECLRVTVGTAGENARFLEALAATRNS
ncbi:MAG TPA: histidinol-phosphate transaminase [Burkholderiales bacterium]|nr:histidinol-phosphate transaminase [Burkholderiales bacterium]